MQLRIENYVKGRSKPIQVTFPTCGYSSVVSLRRVIGALYGTLNTIEHVADGVAIIYPKRSSLERQVIRLESVE